MHKLAKSKVSKKIIQEITQQNDTVATMNDLLENYLYLTSEESNDGTGQYNKS